MTRPAKELLAYVRVDDSVFIVRTLQVGSELWLVTDWLQSPDGRWQTPARAIRIDQLPHQWVSIRGADLVLNETLPKDLLYGHDGPPAGTSHVVQVVPDASHFGWLRTHRVQ